MKHVLSAVTPLYEANVVTQGTEKIFQLFNISTQEANIWRPMSVNKNIAHTNMSRRMTKPTK